MFKERMTRAEWQRIVAEAKQRHDAQDSIGKFGALLVGIAPAQKRPAEPG